MSRLRVLIRSIRENPVAMTSTPDRVEHIFIMLCHSVELPRPLDATVRQLRAHFALLLKPQRARRKKPSEARTASKRRSKP